MPGDYTRCKMRLHMWDDAPAPPTARLPPDGWGDMHFRCTECLSTKRVRINLSSGESRTVYKNPEDWHAVTMTNREWKLHYYRVGHHARVQVLANAMSAPRRGRPRKE